MQHSYQHQRFYQNINIKLVCYGTYYKAGYFTSIVFEWLSVNYSTLLGYRHKAVPSVDYLVQGKRAIEGVQK